MNLRTTLALLVLTAAGAAVFWVGAALPPALNPIPAPPRPADAGTRDFLQRLDPATLTRVEIDRGDRPAVVLNRSAGTWSLPGEWPLDAGPVKELTGLLGGLRPRFEPEPADLAQYGLDRPAVVVKLETADAKHALAFGRKPAATGANPFTQETYVRLDDKPEVLRLGPGLIEQLDRPADYYQQRRLFPKESAAKESNNKEKVDRLTAKSLSVEDKGQGGAKFTVERAADGWQMSSPTRDRLEANARESLLAAVPDLWAERFVRDDVSGAAAVPAVVDGSLPGLLSGLFWASVNTPARAPQWLLTRAGLDAPERSVRVIGDDGRTVTLLIGKSAGERLTHVMRPPPPNFPGPPMEVEEPVEFLYAKLKDGDQVFEIKADRLKDVFVAAAALRDPRPAHFEAADATRLEISQGGQEIVLVKDKDRWALEKPLHADADRQKATDLLNRLSNLEARDKDVIDAADPKAYGLDQPAAVVKVTVPEKPKGAASEGDAAEGDAPTAKTRVLTFRIGKHDDATKKVYVQVDDWPRVNAVADGGSPGDAGLSVLVKREAREYRGKRLFDFPTIDLAKVTVQRDKEPQFVLDKNEKGGWRLHVFRDGVMDVVEATIAYTDADTSAASSLTNALTGLEVLEYVNDAPKPEELDPQYGLGKPELVVRLEFADKTKPVRILHVGKKREGKPGRFARLADDPAAPPTSVFAVADDAFASLNREPLAYLPKQLWTAPPDAATAVRIHRAGQPEYTLTKAGAGWKIGGPFDADASPAAALPLADALAAPLADSCKAFDAPKPAEFGLDQPYLTAALTTADGKEHTLTVGGPTATGAKTRYARADKNPTVYVLGEPTIAALDRPALGLLDPVLFRLGDERLDHVRIRTKIGDKEETIKLELKEKDWQVTEGPGAPFPADKEAAARMQFLWSALRAVSFKDYGPQVKWEDYGLASPSASATVGVHKDGASPVVEHTVALGAAADNGGRYARFDDRPGVAVLDAATVRELSRSHLGFVDPTIFDFDAGAAAALTLHPKQGADVELAKQADGWKLVKPTAEQADEKTLQDLFAGMSHLRAVSVADYPAGNLEPFGLAAPEVTATVRLGADAAAPKHVLLIGKEADAATGDRFAMVEGGKAVVVIPAALARRLTAGPLAFHDRKLVKIASTPDRIRLERDPRKAVFNYVDGAWKMTEPLPAELDQDALQEFLDALLTLRADEFTAEKPSPDELKKYGLDNPEAKWVLKNGDKDLLTLLVGATEKNGGRAYAKLADRDMVFLLSPPLTARALGEYRTPRAVWTEPPDAVQAVGLAYKRAGGGFELAKGDDGWKTVGKPDAKVDARTVEETLAALAGLKLERYAVDKDANFALFGLAPEPEPELSVEVRTKTGKTYTLQLGRPLEGSKRRYARIADPGRTDVFIIGEADAEKIVRDLAAFGKAPAAPALPPP